jgi:hypothetical protein
MKKIKGEYKFIMTTAIDKGPFIYHLMQLCGET